MLLDELKLVQYSYTEVKKKLHATCCRAIGNSVEITSTTKQRDWKVNYLMNI